MTTICSDWILVTDLPADIQADYSAAQQAQGVTVASEILFALTGKQFPGACSNTIRPCTRPKYDLLPANYSHVDFRNAGILNWGVCRCVGPSGCGQNGGSVITLYPNPVISITEIKIDGAVLDPGEYTVYNDMDLYRLRDSDDNTRSWPCCQDLSLPDTEEGTWSVQYQYGELPPESGKLAASVFAAEVIKAAAGADCSLPSNAIQTSRQGVTVVMGEPSDVFANGSTGIHVVDLFIKSVNPNKLYSRSHFINIDTFNKRTRA